MLISANKNPLKTLILLLICGGGGQNNTYLVSLIPFAFLKLLLCLYKIKQTHKKQQQFYKQTIQLFPNLKYPSLQSCKDYQQSLCFQYHLAYLLGEALSKADKIWYKGGYFTLNKKIKEAKHIYKLHQEYKAILKVFNLPYCFIPKESLLQTLSFLKALKHLYNASDSKTTQTFFLHFFNQIPFYTQRPFLLKYKEEILEWLESKEFKEQYIKTNHPYPPLLNPKRLYKKESIEVKSQREDKESKEELKSKEIKSNNEVKSKEIKEDRNRETKEGKEVEIQSKETQSNSKETKEKETQNIKGIIKEISKQQEIQNQKENREELVEVKTEINKGIGDRDSENVESKNEESLQPYANLSYESIPASLAWDLNLPLPLYYKFVWLVTWGSGWSSMRSYLSNYGVQFSHLMACADKNSYRSMFDRILQNSGILCLINRFHFSNEG